MSRLKIEHIVRDFGKNKGVFDLSLDVDDGEFFVLLGPSGCGKTTTLRIIAGLESVDSGHVYLNDMEITNFPPKNRDMAMVFQNYALYPFLTVAGNLAFPLKKRNMTKTDIENRVEEIAKTLGISDLMDMKPGQISGGQKQRVALGRALVRNPSLFLMDEPLSNLDAKLRTTMRGELKRIQKSFGITTVYVTHDQVEAMTLADRVAVLQGGLLEQLDTPSNIYDSPSGKFVASFVGDPQMNLIPGELKVRSNEVVLTVGGRTLELNMDGISVDRDVESLEVDLGIRPEDLLISNTGLRGKVTAVQNLGRAKLEHILLEDTDVQVLRLAQSSEQYDAGSVLSVMPSPQKFYVFDRNTMRRIWPPQKSPGTAV